MRLHQHANRRRFLVPAYIGLGIFSSATCVMVFLGSTLVAAPLFALLSVGTVMLIRKIFDTVPRTISWESTRIKARTKFVVARDASDRYILAFKLGWLFHIYNPGGETRYFSSQEDALSCRSNLTLSAVSRKNIAYVDGVAVEILNHRKRGVLDGNS
jgi:hypothetical protein